MTTKLHYHRHVGVEGKETGEVDVSAEGWEPGRVEVLDSRRFEELKQLSRVFGIELIDGNLEADNKRNADAAAAAGAAKTAGA